MNGMDGMDGIDPTLLLLTDSRLPAGGHAHSGGVEAAIDAGAVRDLDGLAAFLRGRLATAGLVAAALAAAACTAAARPAPDWPGLDAEADARQASPAQREAARVQGRLLLRVARRIWPSPVLDGLARAVPEPHHPVALGAVAASVGPAPGQAALAAVYAAVTGPATAAVRLLGLDPVQVHGLLARLAPAMRETAAAAVRRETGQDGWADLPARAAPVLDLLAERHLRSRTRLFVS